MQKTPTPILLSPPADHIILNEDEFCEVLLTSLEATAKNNWLLTLGITPSRPDTGYGYIQFSEDSQTGYKHISKVKNLYRKTTNRDGPAISGIGRFFYGTPGYSSGRFLA